MTIGGAPTAMCWIGEISVSLPSKALVIFFGKICNISGTSRTGLNSTNAFGTELNLG